MELRKITTTEVPVLVPRSREHPFGVRGHSFGPKEGLIFQ